MNPIIREAISEFSRRHLTGSITLGPLTINGDNAMAFQADLHVERLGVTLSFRPPIRRAWQFYASPNGTPWAAVVACGPGVDQSNVQRIRSRLAVLSQSPHASDEARELSQRWNAPECSAKDDGPVSDRGDSVGRCKA